MSERGRKSVVEAVMREGGLSMAAKGASFGSIACHERVVVFDLGRRQDVPDRVRDLAKSVTPGAALR